MSFRSVLITATVLAAWSASAAAEVIKVGVTPGPHAQILEAVKPIAAKKGLDIQLIEFSDYLDNQKADRGYKIESVGLTVNFPIGVYSKKHKSWSDIPNGGTVSIPNDPTNGGRVLLLLRDKEVIKLKEGVGFKPKISDIIDNPRKLKFIEIDAAQAPRALDDVDAAAINTNYATQAGLDPVRVGGVVGGSPGREAHERGHRGPHALDRLGAPVDLLHIDAGGQVRGHARLLNEPR